MISLPWNVWRRSLSTLVQTFLMGNLIRATAVEAGVAIRAIAFPSIEFLPGTRGGVGVFMASVAEPLKEALAAPVEDDEDGDDEEA
jgi:hypothetical protein